MRRSVAVIHGFCSLGIIAALIGCSSSLHEGPTGTITGQLTIDGNPAGAGFMVSFMEMNRGFLAFGTTDAQGRFRIDSWNAGDMPTGTYKVMVSPGNSTPARDPSTITAEEAFENPELIDPVQPKAPFHPRYRDTTTSQLEFEIKEGPNEFEIPLKTK